MEWHLVGNLAINMLGSVMAGAVVLSLVAAWILRGKLRRYDAADAAISDVKEQRTRVNQDLERLQRLRSELGRQIAAAVGIVAGASLQRTLSETDHEIGNVKVKLGKLKLAQFDLALKQDRESGFAPCETLVSSFSRIFRRHLLLGGGVAALLMGTLCGLQVAGVLPAIFS